jgi:mevalonate kinase
MTQEFYSNGKLLLSGEYAILDGAEGWAIPTKFGQYLKATINSSSILKWTSIDADGTIWFQCEYHLVQLVIVSTTNEDISSKLITILKEAQKLAPNFLKDANGFVVETTLTFPRNWGLGTSSTLINNIAQWSKTNPYKLLKESFGGSGYDIACAQHDSPILFKIKNDQPVINRIEPELSYSEQLFFVYLNQKKNSRDAIAAYRKQAIDKKELTSRITELTIQLYQSKTLLEFEAALNLHETTLSNALNIPTIKEELFPDYNGSIKSLGGWGGDFVMVTARENTLTYFNEKGYNTILSYSEMAL